MADLCRDSLRLGEVEIDECGLATLGHHALSGGATDAAGAAGDEEDLVLEAIRHVWPICSGVLVDCCCWTLVTSDLSLRVNRWGVRLQP